MDVDHYELALCLVGIAALMAAWVPPYLARRPLSLPIILVLAGWVIGAVGLGLPAVDPREYPAATERLTELGVIIALMGAGLKIDRPFGRRSWASTGRMVLVAMPITIALIAALGLAVGALGLASAVLLGAVLAPTDPVLASDVQVGEPTLGDQAGTHEAEDEVRFTLTSEGGLNDALAFPFVYLAIRLAEGGTPHGVIAGWLAWDLGWRVAVGVVVGVGVGRLVGVVAFRPPGPLTALAETPQGFLAVATTLIAYGATEILHGYGFLAVFIAAVALRSSERSHEFHAELHGFVEQTENLLVVGLLLLLGASLASGVLSAVWWQPLAIAVAVVLLVRPVSGQLALLGSSLTKEERWAVSFFGIRGIGSLYYLSYALAPGAADAFDGRALLWATVITTLLVSIAVHGVTATPVMRSVDRSARRLRRARSRRHRRAVAG